MFLVQGDYLIPNFLKALGFMTPNGFSADNIEYVIAPENTSNNTFKTQLTNFGYTEPQQTKDLGIKYVKKDLKSTHSFSDNPIDDNQNGLTEFPKHVQVTQITTTNPQGQINNNDVNEVPTDSIITIKECTNHKCTFMLKEELYGFPRNTLIHMEK